MLLASRLGLLRSCRGARVIHRSRAALQTRAFVGGSPAAASALSPPTAADLLRDSQLAGLSGLTYVPPEELEERLQRHGLHLQAAGNTHFTRWVVACPAHGAADRQHPPAAAAAASSGLGADPGQLYVFLRGVSWRSADLDALRVWQGLVRALPAPFLPHLTSPPDLLQAHSGVAEMAEELFEVLRPHLEGRPRVHLAGHSLGGSLAVLVALTAHLRLGGIPLGSSSGGGNGSGVASSHGNGGNGSMASSAAGQQQPSKQQQQQQQERLRVACTTFGSPPVLALAGGHQEDGRTILRALGLPPGAVKNYVLQDDPVPRALLSADPAFLALKSSPAVAGLLRLREQWLGGGMLSPSRFLFHPAGDVFLIRWTQEAGHSVRLLAPHTLQEELKLDVEALRSSPLAVMQALMDHHHGSYASELRAAASALARQEGKSHGSHSGSSSSRPAGAK